MAFFIYANCYARIRAELWDHLNAIAPTISTPWLIVGDFNIVASCAEKQEGQNRIPEGMHEFPNFIMQMGLIDSGFIGETFTWFNNRKGADRIYQCLDSVLINQEARDQISGLKIYHLPRLCSDDMLLCIRFKDEIRIKGSRFIFQRMWTDHPLFLQMVRNV